MSNPNPLTPEELKRLRELEAKRMPDCVRKMIDDLGKLDEVCGDPDCADDQLAYSVAAVERHYAAPSDEENPNG